MKILCPECGSDNVSSDATVRWNELKLQWEISGIFDDSTCDNCGYEGDGAKFEVRS